MEGVAADLMRADAAVDDPHEKKNKVHRLVMVHEDNYGISGACRQVAEDPWLKRQPGRDDDKPQLRDIVVWGGWVANCAEDSLSRVVDRNAPSLRRVVYAPWWVRRKRHVHYPSALQRSGLGA